MIAARPSWHHSVPVAIVIAMAAAMAAAMAGAAAAAEAISFTPDAAVERGLIALLKLQQPNGSIGDGAGITALSGMALLAGGHTPTRGRYHEASAKALRYVMAEQDANSGYLGGSGMGNMYSHGFATVYLAECYGMAPDPHLRRSLEAALDLVFRCQNAEGGWRYQPAPIDADLSVTVCQVMALRAAYNVGIGGDASQEAMRRAVGYVRRCANVDGSFSYVAGGGGGADATPRTAAGTMCLIGAGINDPADPILGPALRYLRGHVIGHLKGKGEWFWYGEYYASQALFHSPDVNDWQRYWDEAWKAISSLQGEDGLWTRPDGFGPAFGTAMALIILQIPNNYLPIFQR